MIATLKALASEVEKMTPREWELAKAATYIGPLALLFTLHGTGRPDELIALGRAFQPLGAADKFVDYAADAFAHLTCTDSPQLRRLAVATNPHGHVSFPSGPILVMLSHADTRATYARRLRSIIAVLKAQGVPHGNP